MPKGRSNMTNKEWTLLALASQQHVPGAFGGMNAIRSAQRYDRSAVVTTAAAPPRTGSASRRPAASSVNSHELVAHEPKR